MSPAMHTFMRNVCEREFRGKRSCRMLGTNGEKEMSGTETDVAYILQVFLETQLKRGACSLRIS